MKKNKHKFKLKLRNVLKWEAEWRIKTFLTKFGIKFYTKFKYPMTNIKIKIIYFELPFWNLIRDGKWERYCIKHLLKIIKKDQIILDVGAWIGPYTLLFSNLVGEKGKIYSFEPDFSAFLKLRNNLRYNKIKNVKLEKIALYNFIGKKQFYIYGKGGESASSFLVPAGLIEYKENIVEVITIDKYCQNCNISPNGIKIDVEGSETCVLEGCQWILKTYHPWVILEFHGHLMNKNERLLNWYKIINLAKKVIFINGNSKRYCYGDEITDIPDCDYFHIFIQY